MGLLLGGGGRRGYEDGLPVKLREVIQKFVLPILILSLLYVLSANARQTFYLKQVPEAEFTWSLVLVALGGILFGRVVGASVGFLGAALSLLTPAASGFEVVGLLTHPVVGFVAGALRGKYPTPLPHLVLVAAVGFEFFVWSAVGLIPWMDFWKGRYWAEMIYLGLGMMVVSATLAVLFKFVVKGVKA